jgi:2-aminoadipate transaminase
MLFRADLGRTATARLYAMSDGIGVIHIGSFLEVDFAGPSRRLPPGRDVLSRILALKTDAGSGALEQMLLAILPGAV